ncbi:hypothetical protein G5714_024727 [Onychostoma macrolepis]|uniref:Uncharacterized protein n=1 Tax=Onychostoma macrolepis TaxID=369639 RepID=A0A7J6BK28_9TELE|nr:hypothetical protein G5714_024727 [Onychostoma macrolepis]
MEFTTHFGLHSQATRLQEEPHSAGGAATASHRPRAKPPSEGLGPRPAPRERSLYATFPSPAGRAGFGAGSSLFAATEGILVALEGSWRPPAIPRGTGGWPESSRSPPSATHAAGNPHGRCPSLNDGVPPAGRESWGSRPRSSQRTERTCRRRLPPGGDERWRGRLKNDGARLPGARVGGRDPVLENRADVSPPPPAPRGDERRREPSHQNDARPRTRVEVRGWAAEGFRPTGSQGGRDLRPRVRDEALPLPVGEGERRWKGPEEAGRKRTRAVCT